MCTYVIVGPVLDSTFTVNWIIYSYIVMHSSVCVYDYFLAVIVSEIESFAVSRY